MKRLFALFTIAILLSVGAVVYAAGTEGQQKTIEVTNWKGKHVGIAKYIVMDPLTGNITFVILYLDRDVKKEIAVPFAAFSSYDHKNGVFILNVSEEKLFSVPEFHDSDLNNPAYAESIYRFFGLAPRWTEEKREKGIMM